MGWTTKQQNRTSNRFYESMSYILLCNSFALSGTESIFGMEVNLYDRHQPTASLLW